MSSHHYRVPEAVCLLDVGTGVRNLLFTLCLSPARPRRLLILDAIDAGRTPGEIFEIDPAEIPSDQAGRFLAAPVAYVQPAARVAGNLRRRSARAGLPNRAAAGRDLPGIVEPVSGAVPQAAEWLVREYFPRYQRSRHNSAKHVCDLAVEPKFMSPNLTLICDGKKFMWDGRLYASRDEAVARGRGLSKR